MDTNLVSLLLTMLARQKEVPPVNNNSILIVTMIVTALAPTLMALAAFISSRATREDSMEIRKNSKDAAEAVDKIHIAVNSERSAMLEEVKKLKDEILRISTEKATVVEQQRMEQAQVKIDQAKK